MLAKVKRGRGRPVGTGLRDEALLAQVADLMLKDPRCSVVSALRTIGVGLNSAVIRRIQSKFKAQKEGLLAEAQLRIVSRNSEAMANPATQSRRTFSERREARRMQTRSISEGLYRDHGSSVARLVRELNARYQTVLDEINGTNSVAVQLAKEGAAHRLVRGTASDHLAAISKNIASQALGNVGSNTASKAMRDAAEGTVARAMRDAKLGTASQALREATLGTAAHAMREDCLGATSRLHKEVYGVMSQIRRDLGLEYPRF